MAKASRMFGRDMYATFGTHVLSTDFTNMSVNEDGQMVDLSAGSETFSYMQFLRENTTIDYEGWFANDASGSALRAATDPGDTGTLTLAPAGTAAGKPKFECTDTIVANRRVDYPFDNGCRMRISFQARTDWTETSY